MTRPLTARAYRDVTLLPVRATPQGPLPYSFGAHGPDGQSIEPIAHRWCAMRAPEAAARRLPGAFLYAGPAMMHYGHFLIEGLGRLWALRRRADLPIAWHPMPFPFAHDHWPGWMERLVALAGLAGRKHVMVREPLLVERLVVPDLGYAISEFLHPDQAAALAVVPDCGAEPGLRVWLSRAGLPDPYERAEGEREIEALLGAAGWSVVQPEALDFEDQARLFMRAEVVGGMAGSAFHSLLLAARPRARLVVLRRPWMKTGDFEIIAAARGVAQTMIDAELIETGRVIHWRRWRFADPAAAAAAVLVAADRTAPPQ